MLNISELTPIYAELQIEPPSNMPLVFHTNVSLFPSQINEIKSKLDKNEYNIIYIQGTQEGLTDTYIEFLEIMNLNSKYRNITNIINSPGNSMWACYPGCQGNIYVHMKN
jgi:ATP-dependent protease ClpP protease subunit